MRTLYISFSLLLFLFVTKISAQNWTDDFANGNFTSGLKVWSGHDPLWQVSAGMLRSNGDAVPNDTIYLSTSSTHALDVQWEFYARLAFNPSANNFADVYLICDSAEVIHPNAAGYYLRIGSTNDDVKLWYRNGVSTTLLIDGADGILNFTNNTLKIRVTRSAAGVWRLFTDVTGTGSSFSLEGSVTNNTLVSSSYFGVVARHTSTNRDRFYFDDFSVVSPMPIDNTPPTVTSVNVSAVNQLEITFSEAIDLSSSQNPANYSVPGNVVNSATRVMSNKVLLVFQNTFPPSVMQNITVSGVQDLAGNTMVPASFPFQRGDEPVFNDIIINELIGNVTPVVGLPQVEWIELYNRSNKSFNLHNWKITSQTLTGSPTELLLPSFTLLPDTYVVICTISGRDSFSSFPVQVINAVSFNTNFLTTTGRLLSLWDTMGNVIDTVNYLSSWYKNTTKANGGWTIERINPSDTCAAPFDNWAASVDPAGGTPGRQNSIFAAVTNPLPPTLSNITITSDTTLMVCYSVRMDPVGVGSSVNYSVNNNLSLQEVNLLSADGRCVELKFSNLIQYDVLYQLNISNVQNCYQSGAVNLSGNFIQNSPPQRHEVIINEIFPDPTPQVGLPNAEFVEIWNRSNRALNLQGWKLNEGSSNLTPFPSLVLLPDSFLIICLNANYWDFLPYGNVVGVSSFNLLNAGEALTLLDSSGTVIDYVFYTDKWYNDAVKDDGGWTLERIDRNDTCSTAKNWSSSQDASGGTPGRMNSINGILTDNAGPVLLTAVAFTTDSVLVCFDEPLSLAHAGVTGNYSIQNNALIISSVTPQAPDYTCVKIAFTGSLTVGQVYQLEVSNLEDCKGNQVVAGSAVQFLRNLPMQRSDLVINEIFADPSPAVTLPGSQFAEIHNRSDKYFDIAGMKFNSRILNSSIIVPGGYLILTNSNNVSLYEPYGAVSGVPSLSSFTQSAFTLNLLTADDEVIDEVSYVRAWYRDGVKQNGGWTLERINPNDTCASFSNWKASVDPSGGTPGRENSVMDLTVDVFGPEIAEITNSGLDTVIVYFNETLKGIHASNINIYEVREISTGNIFPVTNATAVSPDFAIVRLTLGANMGLAQSYEITIADIQDCKGNSANLTDTFVVGDIALPNEVVINEIYTDFTPQVGLPQVKYLEIYNRSNKPYDMTGWSIRRYNTEGVFTSTYTFNVPRVILPGQYIVIVPTSGMSDYESFTNNIMGAGSLTFNITSDRVALVDAEGVVLDRVAYSDAWYRDNIKKPGGWSLERIDPDFICHSDLNWIASNDPTGGTPGRENSVRNTFIDQAPPVLLNAYMLGSDTVVLRFNESLDFNSILSPSAFTISGGVGSPAAIYLPNLTAGDYSLVYLISPISLTPNTVYEVSIQGIMDCPGNAIVGVITAKVAIPVTPSPKDILINEILFHPYTRRTRFVEIYNNSDNIFDLNQLYLSEGVLGSDSLTSIRRVHTEPKLYFPKSYLCLTPNVQDQMDIYQPKPEAQFHQMASIPAYNSTEDECVFFYSADPITVVTSITPITVLDRFRYKATYHFTDLVSRQGVSLERLNFGHDSQNPDMWHSAASTVNYATPGYQNSQQLRPEAIGEVSVSPETFSPDGDGFDDVLAINYQFTRLSMNARVTVYDVTGNSVKIVRNNFLLETESGYVTWDGTNDNGQKAPVGVYVVVFEAIHQPTGDKFVYKVPCVLAARLN